MDSTGHPPGWPVFVPVPMTGAAAAAAAAAASSISRPCRAGARRSLPRGPSSTQGRDAMIVGASIPACPSVSLRSPPLPVRRGRYDSLTTSMTLKVGPASPRGQPSTPPRSLTPPRVRLSHSRLRWLRAFASLRLCVKGAMRSASICAVRGLSERWCDAREPPNRRHRHPSRPVRCTLKAPQGG